MASSVDLQHLVQSPPHAAPPTSEATSSTFQQTCCNIGLALAPSHSVLLAATTSNTADYFVCQGLMQSATKHNTELRVEVHLYGCPEDEVDSQVLSFIDDHGGSLRNYAVWEDAHHAALQECDFVIAVGGRENTERICNKALDANKMVIPLAAFGGSAGRIYASIHRGLIWQGMDHASVSKMRMCTFSNPADVDSLHALIQETLTFSPWPLGKLRHGNLLLPALVVIAASEGLYTVYANNLIPRTICWVFPVGILAAVTGKLLNLAETYRKCITPTGVISHELIRAASESVPVSLFMILVTTFISEPTHYIIGNVLLLGALLSALVSMRKSEYVSRLLEFFDKFH